MSSHQDASGPEQPKSPNVPLFKGSVLKELRSFRSPFVVYRNASIGVFLFFGEKQIWLSPSTGISFVVVGAGVVVVVVVVVVADKKTTKMNKGSHFFPHQSDQFSHLLNKTIQLLLHRFEKMCHQ